MIEKLLATIAAQAPLFRIVERVVFLVAALFALFPLWQFYIESDARRLDRVFNFVVVGEACERIQADVTSDFGSASFGQSASDKKLGQTFFGNGITTRNLHELCSEIGTSLAADEILKQTMERLRSTSERVGPDSAGARQQSIE